MSLDYYNNIKFINVFIVEFVKYEEYEAAAYFKEAKLSMYRSWRKKNRLLSARLFYRVWRLRINKLLK